MWSQLIIVFLQLTALPTFSLAQCSDANVTEVIVTNNVARWAVSYDPSCFVRLEVCWSQPPADQQFCRIVSATSNQATLTDTVPCQPFSVVVTGVAEDSNETIAMSDNAGYSDPVFTQFVVSKDKVQWAGSYGPSCLTRLEVCWNQQSVLELFCKSVSATSSETALSNIVPCQSINAQIMAVRENSSSTVSREGSGTAGPPSISNLTVVTATRFELKLSWSSVVRYTCVGRVELWICENAMERLSACIYKQMDPKITDVTLYNYDIPVCHYLNVSMRTANNPDSSDMNTLEVYIPSDNQVLNATAINVTSNSALLEYSLQVLDHGCTDESLEICYEEREVNYLRVCASYPLEEVESNGVVQLTNLHGCTSFTASLRTKQNIWYTGVDFITPKDDIVLRSASADNNYGTVTITWATSERISCVSLFNVTWNSTLEPELRWSAEPVFMRSYTIHASSGMNQTLYVNVAAVFLDGDEESISLHVDIDSGLISSSIRPTDSTVLILLSAALSLRLFGVI